MITSLQNPLVKRLVSLRDRKTRAAEEVFLIEGEKELRHAVAGGIILEQVVRCAEVMEETHTWRQGGVLEEWLLGQGQRQSRVEEVSARVYAKIAYRENAEGVVAVARLPRRSLADIPLRKDMTLLIADGVEKPGNLGALLRTADGAGMDAVIVCGEAVDVYNPNVVRASVGALFTLPVVEADAADVRLWLRDHHFTIVMTSPAASKTYDQVDYQGRTALVLGSEAQGLGPDWLNCGGTVVRIPMRGKMDSLNLSCCGAILMYACRRQ